MKKAVVDQIVLRLLGQDTVILHKMKKQQKKLKYLQTHLTDRPFEWRSIHLRACVNACMRKYFGIFIFFLPHNVLRAGHTLQKLIRNKSRCCHPCDDKQHLSVLLIRRWRIIITHFRLRRKRIKLLAGDVIVLFHGLVYIIKSLLCVVFVLYLLIDKIQSLHSLLTPSCLSCF